MRKGLMLILSLVVALGLPLPGIVVSGAGAAPPDGSVIDLPPMELLEKGHPKLESVLWQLIDADERGQAPAFAQRRAIDLVDGRVRVIIEAVPGQTVAATTAAEALDGNVETSYENLVQVVVPIPRLIGLANNPNVGFVRLPWVSVPVVTSQGVSLINADDWQSAGFTGSGEKVGILDLGFSGYSGLLGTELPASVTTWWAPSVGGPGTEVHGTACAEIVYDIAPNADFYLANVGTSVEWANAIDWLISQGVDVISCSVCWLNTGPGNGTGAICDKVTDARNAGVLWSQSAGNYAQTHWMGAWDDTNPNNWHDFNPGVDETNFISANSGDIITVGLKWDDTWGLSSNNYNLYLLDSGFSIVAGSTNWQTGTQKPRETLQYTAPYTGWYHIAINNYLGLASPVEFHLFTFHQDLQYQVASSSLLEPADSPNAMTVGAVDWNNPNVIESFSSQGPNEAGLTKPDLVGPDRVSTATYGPGGFGGTSASAPHAAGAAALVKDRYPAYTPTQMQNYLEGNAVDLGAPGKDNVFGSGRLNLPAPPPIPADYTGYVYVGGVKAGAGLEVWATLGDYTSDSVTTDANGRYFGLLVAPPEGYTGTIHFYVAGAEASETSTFVAGSHHPSFDLHVTAIPTPTPTPTPPPPFGFEVGQVSINHTWTTVDLTQSFTDPVVVAKPLSYNGGHPATVRIRNVTSTSFDIRIQEWNYLDGWHTTEQVSYMVMEKGHFGVDGAYVEAGTIDTNSTGGPLVSVPFSSEFRYTPVVVSSVMSFNGPDTVVTRNMNVTTTGFQVTMQEQQSNAQVHIQETISYIAWEPGSGTVGEWEYEVGTEEPVNHNWSTISYGPFGDVPIVLMDMQTANGPDPCNLRYVNKDADSVDVKVDEEQSADAEKWHVPERVGYFAFS